STEYKISDIELSGRGRGRVAVPEKYDLAYGAWRSRADVAGSVRGGISARESYRVSWRTMAATTGERTLIPALYPPGVSHVDGVFSVGIPGGSSRDLLLISASTASIIDDFFVRSTVGKHIRQ